MASFTPYVSEFDYSPEFHPSRNPSCPRRWARGVWSHRRSPEEGGPVGQEPSIEIRAVLVRCPKSHEEMSEVPINAGTAYNITAGRSQDILGFHGFDRDEPAHHSEVRNCRRKLIVTMKFNNIGKTRTQEEFVVVDHVLDPVTMHKARLLNPFVFKVRQEQVLQLYGLRFQSVVNGEAKEEVINKKSSNYTGCDDSLVNPTCGQMMFDGKPMPYSQGFCCSCDSDVNLARQPVERTGNLSSNNFGSFFASPRNSPLDLLANEHSMSHFESLRNPERLLKRERSLKSSRAGQAGLADEEGGHVGHEKLRKSEKKSEYLKRTSGEIVSDKNGKRIHFPEDYTPVQEFLDSHVSPAFRTALLEHNPGRGKIPPYIDDVRNEALVAAGGRIIDENSDGLSSIKENVDSDIFREYKESGYRKFGGNNRLKEKYRTAVSRPRNEELTAELVELEKEYKALKNSKRRIKSRGAKRAGKKSKCTDFRKLARGRNKYLDTKFRSENNLRDIPTSEMGVEKLNIMESKAGQKGRNKLTCNTKHSAASDRKRSEDKPEIGILDYQKNHSIDESSSNEAATPMSTYSISFPSSKAQREELNSTNVLPVTKSNLYFRSSSATTKIPSNNTRSISTYPPLILRQEFVNDTLYLPSSGSTNVSGFARDVKAFKTYEGSNNSRPDAENDLKNSRNSSASLRNESILPETIKLRGSLKDQYADWVIKYAIMNNNHYINSQIEEPLQTYDLDMDSESFTDAGLLEKSPDTLGHIADKVLKEFESAENDESLHQEGVEEEVLPGPVAVVLSSVQALNNPELSESFENLGSSRSGLAIPREAAEKLEKSHSSSIYHHTGNADKESSESGIEDASENGKAASENRENSSKTWQDVLTSKVEGKNGVKPLDKLVKKSSEKKSGANLSEAKIDRIVENLDQTKNYSVNSGKKMIEPAVIVRGTGDLVKGNFRYKDQSATVIADRRSDDTQAATDQDYIFLDENGREQSKEERLKSLESHDRARLMNLRKYLRSDGSNNSRLHSMGEKIEESLTSNRRYAKNDSMQEKFDRLDNLVRDSLKSRRRSFRSVAYDDPFHRGNDKKQAKIDEQIEKEFAEITDALKESSDSEKHAVKLSSSRNINSSKDSMIRDFAVMLNRIPKIDVLKVAGENVASKNGIERFDDFRTADNRRRKYGRKRLSSITSRKRKNGSERYKSQQSYSTNVNSETPGYSIRKKGDFLSEIKKPSGIHAAVFERARHSYSDEIRSSTGKYSGAIDRVGVVESQTNINEIVKQIIRNDYRPSSPWIRKHENIPSGNKSNQSSILSLKGFSQNLHTGKLQKKCHDGVTPLLHDDEKDGGQSLPPEESTIITAAVHGESKTTTVRHSVTETNKTGFNGTLISEKVFNNVESTIPAEVATLVSQNTSAWTTVPPVVINFATNLNSMETTAAVAIGNLSMTISPIIENASTEKSAMNGTGLTGSSQTTNVQNAHGERNHSETTAGETLETEILTLSQELTTALSTVTTSSLNKSTSQNDYADSGIIHDNGGNETTPHTSSTMINRLEKFSNKLKSVGEIARSVKQARNSDERDHKVIERSPIEFEGEELNEFEGTTWLTDADIDSHYEGGAISNEESSDVDRAVLRAENLELKEELNEARRALNSGQTTGRNEVNDDAMPTFISYDDTTEEDGDLSESSTDNDVTDNVLALTVYEETTIGQKITSNNHEEGTTRSDSRVLESGTISPEESTTLSQPTTSTTGTKQLKTSELGTTTLGVSGSLPGSQTPNSFGKMLGSNNTGESSVILVKTYSVSKNPKEFLDNYAFPVGVKKVLLKQLNLTALIHDPVDSEIGESFAQKVNKLVINDEQDADDSEIHQAEVKKGRFYDKVNDGVALEKSSKDHKPRINDADNLSGFKKRRIIHEPSIDDLKLQQFQQDTYKGVEFNQQEKREREGNNSIVDLDPMMNEVEKKTDNAQPLNNEFVRNDGSTVTRSFTTVDTLPPDDVTTHNTWGDDVNATNLQFNYIMEQPIFAQPSDDHVKPGQAEDEENEKRSYSSPDSHNLEEKLNPEVEFFYDYDLDSNANEGNAEVKRFYRSIDVRSDTNNDDQDSSSKIEYKSIKKREAKEYSEEFGKTGGAAFVNQSTALRGEKMVKLGKIPEIISQKNEEIEVARLPRCGEGKWQGKMDFLKLKKHQDILKEYLNWSPNVDTTVMRIFSIYSTSAASPTTPKSFGKQKDTHDSSTMSILLIDDAAKEKSPQSEETKSKNESGMKELDDREILDKLSRMPIDDNLMIISVMEKNKPNATVADNLRDELTGEEKHSVNKKYVRAKTPSSKTRERRDEAGRHRRNINFSPREARNISWKGRSGRRLMSTAQMSENRENGFVQDENTPESEEEVVETDEAMPEYEDLVPKGVSSRFDYLDNSYKKHKRDKLKSNWDQLVDKIIVSNNNDPSTSKKRNSNKQPDEVPSDKGKTAMEKLHFFDADKYIKLMAKKISRLSNVDNSEQDLGAGKENNATNNSVKTINLSNKNYQNFYEAEKDAAFVDDDKKQANEDALADYADESPRETVSRLAQGLPVSQNPFFGKLGSDFEISISGKVHINGESIDQPMSISIDGVSVDNVTSNGNRMQGNVATSSFQAPKRKKNGTEYRLKEADHIYLENGDQDKILGDRIPANGGNEKETFYGEAGASASSNITGFQPKRDFFIAEKVANARGDSPEVSRAMDMNKMDPEMFQPEVSRISNNPRKTFYNVVVRAHPRYEKRPVHETRDFNGANESSEDLKDDFETEERGDPPENDRGKSAENLMADEPVFDFAKLELRHEKPSAQNNFQEEEPAFSNHPVDQSSPNDEVDADLAAGSTKNSHSRRLRQERAMQNEKLIQYMSMENPGSDESVDSTTDIKLVKLIPLDLLNENELSSIKTEERNLLDRNRVHLITSNSPKMDFVPSAITAFKKTEIKPVRYLGNDLHIESKDSLGPNKKQDGLIRLDDDSSNDRQSLELEKIDDADASRVEDDDESKENDENLQKTRSNDPNEGSKLRRDPFDLLKSVLEKGSRNAKITSLKNYQDALESEAREPLRTKTHTTVSPVYISKISGPCYEAKETTRVVEKPFNTTGNNLNSTSYFSANFNSPKQQEAPEKVHLSTDDLHPPSPPEESLIKGVKISSPGDNSRDLPEQESDLDVTSCGRGENEMCESSEEARKTIELKNLMTMMNFIKKLENFLPGSDDEAEVLDEGAEPETVVQVQSVLLLPEDTSMNEEAEYPQTTSERVVEIGEGVRHSGETCHSPNSKNLDIIVPGNPTRIKSLSFGKDVDKTFDPESSILLMKDKDENKSLASGHQTLSKPRVLTSNEGLDVLKNYGTINDVIKNFTKVRNKKKPENPARAKTLSKEIENKIKHRLLDDGKRTSSDERSHAELSPSTSVLEKNLYESKNDRLDVSNANNDHSLGNLRTGERSSEQSSNYHVKNNAKVDSDDGLNLLLDDRLKGNTHRAMSFKKMTNGKDKGFEFKERNELPEIVASPFKFYGAKSKPSSNRLDEYDASEPELDKIGNILDKEGLVDLERKERQVLAIQRQDHQRNRQARTPMTYAVGVSEMEATRLKDRGKKLSSMENIVHKKKRGERDHLARRKILERRKGGRYKPKVAKKQKKKKRKKWKWWPFKRNLLAIFEDQESPLNDRSHDQPVNSIREKRGKKSKLKRASSPRRKKRQIKAGGAQIRGGQDCMDRRHPPHVNSAKYQESAHCLRFSDLWYSVYELETPIMEHTVYLQLFEKHMLPDGTTHWDDLTQGSMVRLGTFVRHQRDSAPTIAFTYSGAKIGTQKQAHNLDPVKDRLLVPSPVPLEKLAKYPEVKGGSGEYLVVQSNAINKERNECDKAGVSFATFATQPNRCGNPEGTCLKNQPLAYWRHDVGAREAGRPGCYFLSNFASVPNNPIKYNVSGSGSREYLGLEYHQPHVSAIDIEVRADYNAIVRVGSSGRVTEVYVDSTAPEHTILTIVVSNMGLASSPYQSRISDCPTGLPISWSKAKGAMQVIPPQHDQRITLDLYGQLYVDDFHCSVEVVNHRGELVAMRRIRVQKMDRCFCVWHCLCACFGSVAGLGCQPMSPEHYHAAGFQGPVPVVSMEQSEMVNAIKDVAIFSALVVLVLLVLGMLKWLIGIFLPAVSRWGLDALLDASQLKGYFEPELRCRSIVRDVDGSIVHPDSGKKSVRICSRRWEFFLNLIFLLTYPIAVWCNCVKSSLAASKRDCSCQDESKVSLLRDESTSSSVASSCGKLICVDTYGDSRNSKMEVDDTKYVMNELKRSRDSLQDGMEKRCKSCRSPSRSSNSSKIFDNKDNSASLFVDELIKTRVVFRNLKHPIGGLNVPARTLYSLRGYFMNAENGGYRFITPCPFKQHWLIDNNVKKPLKPGKIYPSNQFMRTFTHAVDVYESEEISLRPKGICINVHFFNEE